MGYTMIQLFNILFVFLDFCFTTKEERWVSIFDDAIDVVCIYVCNYVSSIFIKHIYI